MPQLESRSESRPTLPSAFLQSVARRYPGAWRQYRDFRGARGSSVPDWPGWCYAPMAAAYAIISGGGSNRVPPGRMMDIAALAACAAWRPTQGVYRFDRPLLASLWEQPHPDTIEAADLTRLPRWGAYVDLSDFEPPGAAASAGRSEAWDGLFLHLEHDARDGHAELRGLFVREDLSHSPVLLDLGGSQGPLTVPEGARSVIAEALRVSEQQGQHVPILPGLTAAMVETVRPALSLALYLASDLAEIEPAPAGPDERAARHPAPQSITLHTVS